MTVAQRLAFEGHGVDFFCQARTFDRAGKGVVNRVDNWRVALRRADLVLGDSVGQGRFAEAVQASGRPYIGFNRALDALELDRRKGMELFEHVGVKTPETHYFTTVGEAEKLPSKLGWGDGWVVKANNNAGAEKTAVVKEKELWPRAIKALPPGSTGILQRVLTGVEVSTEGWFNGSSFITPFNHTFEEKKFLNGGLGQTTGCQGNVVVRADGTKLVYDTVAKAEPFLKLLGYRGPFDINCIVTADGAYALECTSRFGYDAIEALAEGLEEPLGDFLFDIAMGTKKAMALTSDTMISVRLSQPPWPVRAPDHTSAGEPILGVTDETLHHLFLADVAKEDGKFVTAACDGVLLKATAVGSVRPARLAGHKPDYTWEARRRVYRLLDRIEVSNKQYRTDIGVRVNDDIAQLKEWGWI